VTFTEINVPQRSAAWFAARAGRVTGSVADAMLSKGRGSEESTGKRDLRIRLAQERIAGMSLDSGGYVSPEMQRGVDLEPEAISAYEAQTGELVRKTGFLSVDDLLIGASLDGHTDDYETIVSIKCPKSSTHLEYAKLAQGEIPKAYAGQIAHELLITGAKAYHFVSYDNRFAGPLEPLQLVINRIPRERVDLVAYEKALRAFLADVEREAEMLLTLVNPAKQMEASLAV
jgi:putative phage-type endonuclease